MTTIKVLGFEIEPMKRFKGTKQRPNKEHDLARIQSHVVDGVPLEELGLGRGTMNCIVYRRLGMFLSAFAGLTRRSQLEQLEWARNELTATRPEPVRRTAMDDIVEIDESMSDEGILDQLATRVASQKNLQLALFAA